VVWIEFLYRRPQAGGRTAPPKHADLQRSEFYLAEGQRLAHEGSWAFDPDGFDYWSPELFRIHGLDPTGKGPTVQEYLDRVHPQDREAMANLIQGILAKPSAFDTTKRIVRPNDEIRYIRCVGAPVVENESLKTYVGSALDVTEQELVTQELRRRESYRAKAQRLSHTGNWGWKPDGGEVVWAEFHGSVYEFFRNDVLDAENFFAIKKDELRRNQFGRTFGGPIIKDKTFFFFSYEGLRLRQGQIQIATVPSDAQRTGNFSTQGTVTNIDPTAAALLPLIPRANVGTNEFVSSPVQLLRATSKDAGTGRWGTCSRKLIPCRGKRCFISTNRTCWNKA
jgi:hypothetical protein